MTSLGAGLAIGLVATAVQSWGLALQRKSHLQNEDTPAEQRLPDWKRPLWLTGFSVYLASNIGGSVFQLQALPIVILAPLGAISLIWNAIFALLILDEHFAQNLIYGTILITAGAVLIAIFGAVPEPSHDLQELLVLYTRPAFLAVFFSLCFVVLVVLAIAHAVEWTVHRRRAAARHSASSDKLSHREAAFDRLTAASTADDISNERQPLLGPFGGHSTASTKAHDRQHPEKRLLLFAGLAYGSCSGALSGLGLLFAKTGVELLTLSLFGHHQNQFVHWQAWMIVLVLLVTDLTQLWYLNHSLRLLGPTLICPLACCFFNLSSIFNGLVFYNQWAYLTPLKTSMLSLGIVVLLAGVWVVSLMPGPPPASTRGDAAAEGTEEAVELFEEPLLGEEAGPYDWDNGRPGTTAATASSSSRLHPNRLLALKHMLLEEAPRGFRIGLAASSPGFAIRPLEHYRRPLSGTPESSEAPQYASVPPNMTASLSSLPDRPQPHSTPPHMTSSTSSLLPRPLSSSSSGPRHRKQRSLAGDVYVGRRSSLDLSARGTGSASVASPPLSPRHHVHVDPANRRLSHQ